MEDFKVGSVVYLKSNPERKMPMETVNEVAIDVAYFATGDDTYVRHERFAREMLAFCLGKPSSKNHLK
jgi:hypothetical protein